MSIERLQACIRRRKTPVALVLNPVEERLDGKFLNNFTNTILFISYFRIFYAVPLSSAIPTDSCEASVVRSTPPLVFCACLSP